uniref:Uncharacterized protein n=1 Tax=Plectus sambesii TaxID=2011161 RepID=A0A914W5Z5_9BILA
MADLANDALVVESNNNQMNNNDGERLVTVPPQPAAVARAPARVIKRLSPEDRCVVIHPPILCSPPLLVVNYLRGAVDCSRACVSLRLRGKLLLAVVASRWKVGRRWEQTAAAGARSVGAAHVLN